MACADISPARCSVVGSCCCRQLGLEGFYCCGVNSIRQFVPLPCCSGEERVVVVILGAHWDLVLVAVCVARQYPPLLLKEIVSVIATHKSVYSRTCSTKLNFGFPYVRFLSLGRETNVFRLLCLARP